MNKILIDFVGGSHGHFLESILNGLDADSPDLINDSPFRLSDNGTCRIRIYDDWSLRFCAEHFFDQEHVKKYQPLVDSAEHCISIRFHPDNRDIMRYLRVVFDRGLWPSWPQPGTFDQLHKNFFYKTSSKKMLRLRNYAIEEGGRVSEQNPDVEIYILRNALARRMLSPTGDFLTGIKQLIPFYPEKTQHVFMFSWFYNQEKFMAGIAGLSAKFNLKFEQRQQRVRELHTQFLNMNKFANDHSYEKCRSILDNLDSPDPMPDLDILEQAWILNQLQILSGKKINYNKDEFFKTPLELYQYITLS
jgi:hypothetical protein